MLGGQQPLFFHGKIGGNNGCETMVRPPQLRHSSFPSQAEVLKGPLTLVTTWNHPTLVTAGGVVPKENVLKRFIYSVRTAPNVMILVYSPTKIYTYHIFSEKKQDTSSKGVVFFPFSCQFFGNEYYRHINVHGGESFRTFLFVSCPKWYCRYSSPMDPLGGGFKHYYY